MRRFNALGFSTEGGFEINNFMRIIFNTKTYKPTQIKFKKIIINLNSENFRQFNFTVMLITEFKQLLDVSVVKISFVMHVFQFLLE